MTSLHFHFAVVKSSQMETTAQSPGELIKELLTANAWTQDDLAAAMDRSRQSVNEMILGKTALTPETAMALATVFGNDFDTWWMLEGRYRQSLLEGSEMADGKRLSILKIAPIKDMQKRGWLTPDKSVDELEPELKEFFGTDDLEKDFELPMAFKRTVKDAKLNRAELAWSMRAIHLAAALPAIAPFDHDRMDDLLRELRKLAAKSKAVHKVPELLAKYGIRFVIVEPLPRAKIDGAAFWLTESAPVIALSVRFDNIGSFWFCLMHECVHIKHRDSFSVDTDMESKIGVTANEQERRANTQAAEILIPQWRLNTFIERSAPYYSYARINDFATQLQIHPGIIVGQLHHRKEVGYSKLREVTVKIRDLVTLTAFTDGWGHPMPHIKPFRGTLAS